MAIFRRWSRPLLLLGSLFGQGALLSQQCTRFASVRNESGAAPSGISFHFAGFAPTGISSIILEPDAAPVCGPATTGGILFDEVGIGWPSECVDSNSVLTVWFTSSEPIPDITSAAWADSSNTYAIPQSELTLSPDCNGNCIDDGLDIGTGSSPDHDQNGVPDECQPITEIPTANVIGLILLFLSLCGFGLRSLRRSRI